MKKFNYRSSTQRKKNLKYGGYATVTTLILLAALVLGNVLFSLLDFKVDLTTNELYTPSEQTMQVLDSLEDDVVIYGLYNQGTEDNEVNAKVIKLIDAYTDLSGHVSFEKVDPLTDPAFVNQFLSDDSQSLTNGSLIVQNQNSKKYKTIPLSNLYETESDYDTLTQNITAFSAEEQLSTAIQYVCNTETPVLYQLQGHSEATLTSKFIRYLGYANYSVDTMNLILDNITELEATDYTVVLVNNPRQDLNEDEYKILLDYMEKGGRMLFLAASDMPELPNFERLLARYGLSIEGGMMVETDMNYYYQNYPYAIIPVLGADNDITKYMVGDTNNYCLMVAPAAIVISDEKSTNTKVNAIVTTSKGALLKKDDYQTLSDKEDGDQEGPFNLCVVAEEGVTLESGDLATTKLVVIGSSDFIDVEQSLVTTGNYKLTTLVCDYLQDSVDQLFISSKSLEEATISTTSADFLFYGALFTIVIPLIIIVCGIVIWVRRKHL